LAQTLIGDLTSRTAVWCFGRTPPTSNSKFFQVDLAQPDAVASVMRRAYAEQPPKGIVFCQRYRPAPEVSEIEAIQRGLAVELGPLFSLLCLLEGSTAPTPLRSIVLLSSVAGKESHPDISINYHILKATTLAASRCLAPRLGPLGIRLNCVVLGEFLKVPRHSYPDHKVRQFGKLEKFTLEHRICSAEDISKAIRFLLSDDSAFLTGQELILDGGISLLGPESLIRGADVLV
jgi:NAD(P)-dependent dehydrogenase (short-subunit alcohol dehydrogenase family)